MPASIVIDRPPAEVFAFIADPSRLEAWQDAVAVQQLTPAPVGVGTRFREVHRAMGRERVEITEITEFEPGRRFAIRVVDGPPVDGAWDFAATGDGATRLTFTPRARVRPRLRGLVESATSLVFRRHHRRLKAAVEAGGAPAPTTRRPPA
jgi:uncharacterized protein YndB with AHSA1/START domain